MKPVDILYQKTFKMTDNYAKKKVCDAAVPVKTHLQNLGQKSVKQLERN